MYQSMEWPEAINTGSIDNRIHYTEIKLLNRGLAAADYKFVYGVFKFIIDLWRI